jgi:hypothetical protein
MTLNWTVGLAAAAGAVGGAFVGSYGAKALGKGKHQAGAGAVGLLLGSFLAAGLASPAAPATTSGTGTAGAPPAMRQRNDKSYAVSEGTKAFRQTGTAGLGSRAAVNSQLAPLAR